MSMYNSGRRSKDIDFHEQHFQFLFAIFIIYTSIFKYKAKKNIPKTRAYIYFVIHKCIIDTIYMIPNNIKSFTIHYTVQKKIF